MDKNMRNLVEGITSLLGNEGVTIKAFENGKPIVDIENGVNKLNEAINKPSLEGNPDYVKVPKDCLTVHGLAEFDRPETKDKDFCFVPKSAVNGHFDPVDTPCAKGCSIPDYDILDKDGNLDEEKVRKAAKKLAKELLGLEMKEESSEENNDAVEPKNGQESEDEITAEVEFGPREQFTDITPNIYKDDFDETYFIRHSAAGNRIVDESILPFDFTAVDGVTTPGVTDADILMVLMYRNRDNEKVFNLLKDALVSL